MADLSEYRGVIVIITLLSVFVLLVLNIPPEFITGTLDTQRYVDVPDYLEMMDIAYFNATWNNNIDNGTLLGIGWWRQEIDDGSGTFGGWEFDLLSQKASGYDIRINQYTIVWWIFRSFKERATWYDEGGVSLGDTLDRSELLATYQEYGFNDYTCQTGDTSFKVIFSFNTTEYDDPLDAWDDSNNLYVFCGMNYDNTQTTYNAWDMITAIMFFQRPDILGIPLWVNLIIAVPIWSAMLYIMVKMIQSFIPLIGD